MNTSRSTGLSNTKLEGNGSANKALTLALGLNSQARTNWSCCHIWGVDDPFYQLPNDVVMDRRFFSCVGNMVLLPTPLKAFTDAMPDVKSMLRICARNLYGWSCDHDRLAPIHTALDNWNEWISYPESWPRSPNEKRPLGVVALSDKILIAAQKRKAAIRRDLKNPGENYPKAEVEAVLAYWKVNLD